MKELEGLKTRKDVIHKGIIRKQRRLRDLTEIIQSYQQRKYRVEEGIALLKKEYEILDREIFKIEHPKGARERLRDLEKEVGKKAFAEAVRLLRKEKASS
jgi:hypothetical protein